jgi:copper transport protein
MSRLPLLAGIGVVLGATWMPTPALAHAALEESDPANGAILQTAPGEIRLTFTEPPDRSLTTIGVDAAGSPVETGPPEQVAGSPREIRVRIPQLNDGVYTVTWRTVSTTDGHVTAGALSFGIGVSRDEVDALTPRDGTETPPPSPLAVAGRWALYVGLAVLFGAAVAGLVTLGPAAVERPAVLAIAWIAAAVGVVVITLEERVALSVTLGALLSSDAGGNFVRLAVAVGVAGIATLVAAVRTSRATLAALAVATSGAMLVRALGGHAGGSALSVGAQWLHLMAVGTWIGGLAWLVLGLRRGLGVPQVRRFSNLAAAGLVVLFTSGFVRAANELGGLGWWLDPFENDYGTALVVKLGIVVPLVGLGAFNRFRNVARFEHAGSRLLLRTVGAELGLAATVFAVTGVMTGLPPQEGTDHARAERPLVVSGSDFATTTRVRLEISPGTVGPNEFVAVVTDFDTGEPVHAQRVTLAFELPERPEFDSELELDHRNDGTWHAETTTFAAPGTWNVAVLVEGAGDSATVDLQVTPRVPEQRVEVSRAPGQPDLYTIFLGGDVQIQAYVDAGTPGRTNQVHVTAFEEGTELPLRSAVIGVTPPSDERFEPDLLRLGPGHFAANVELTPGTWSFDIGATARDGRVLSAAFQQGFEG